MFWSEDVAKGFAEVGIDGDPTACEREYNCVNLRELLYKNAWIGTQHPELVDALVQALTHFWGIALKEKFPDRRFVFAVVNDIPGEGGHPCFTFWQDRS